MAIHQQESGGTYLIMSMRETLYVVGSNNQPNCLWLVRNEYTNLGWFVFATWETTAYFVEIANGKCCFDSQI